MTNRRETLSRLRSSVDGNDGFIGGHQIICTAGATRHAQRMENVPAWALDDSKIAEYVKLRFPKAQADSEQRRLAARMLRLIHLYYRFGATATAVAAELGMSTVMVKKQVHKLERQMAAPLKPHGRPKKGVSIRTENEDRHVVGPRSHDS